VSTRKQVTSAHQVMTSPLQSSSAVAKTPKIVANLMPLWRTDVATHTGTSLHPQTTHDACSSARPAGQPTRLGCIVNDRGWSPGSTAVIAALHAPVPRGSIAAR